MLKIIQIANYGEIHYYAIALVNNFHNLFIGFLKEFGFDKEEISKVDTPFFNLAGEYIPLIKKGTKLHLFIEEEKINMVIDTKLSQEKLNTLLKKYFHFPN